MSDSEVFIGFDAVGTTSVPDTLFDELLTVLSWDQLKVVLYIIRRTRGFQKGEDTISLSQFTDGITTKDGQVLDRGCGIKNRTRVSKILKDLEKGGYIEIVRPKAKTGLITYRLHYRDSSVSSTVDASVPSPTHTVDSTVPSARDASVPSARDASVPSARYATVPHNRQLAINSKQQTDIQESTYTLSITPISTSSADKVTKGSIFTAEEETLKGWLEADNPRKGKPETLKTNLQKMLPHVDTKEKAHDLFLHTKRLIMQIDRIDKTVSVGNMVEDWILTSWLQAQQQEPTSDNAQEEAKTDEIEAVETEPVSTPASRPQRRRTAMIPGIANDLAGQILSAYPDAHVEIRSWNGALQRVYLAYGDEWLEFANAREWNEWLAEYLRQLDEIAV